MEANVSSLSLPAGDARATNDVMSNPTLRNLEQHFYRIHRVMSFNFIVGNYALKRIFYRPKFDWFTRSFYSVISTVVVVKRVIGRTGSEE